MKAYKSNFSLFLIFFILFSANAQKKTIVGKVTTYKTIPIYNATVVIKKSKESATTNKLGLFTLECDAKDKLSIKVVGFKAKTIKLKGIKDSIHIDLVVAGDESDLDLAAKNKHINQIDLAEAKKRFNTKLPYSHGFTNITDLLKNKFPQAIVSENDIIFRGINSAAKDSEPGAIIVINDVVSSMDALKSINLTDIKNIKVLTGSAAFRYGTGSGNSVLSVILNSI